MQSAMTVRHNGSTRFLTSRSTTFRLTLEQVGSVFLPPANNTLIKEFKIFPSLFAHPSECVKQLSLIVTILFAKLGSNFFKQIKILQSPTYFFGFFKTILAIPNLAHSCFSLSLQNPNKLNAYPQNKWGASHIFAPLTPFNHRASNRRMVFFLLTLI